MKRLIESRLGAGLAAWCRGLSLLTLLQCCWTQALPETAAPLQILWEFEYINPTNRLSGVYDFQIDENENIYLGGDFGILKYNPNRELLWHSPMENQRLIVDSSGIVAVNSGLLFKLNHQGQLLWEEDGSPVDTSAQVVRKPDGDLFVARGNEVERISPSGQSIWKQSIGELTWLERPGFGLGFNNDLAVVMNLYESRRRYYAWRIAKLTQDGRILWTNSIPIDVQPVDGNPTPLAVGVRLGSDGSVFVFGQKPVRHERDTHWTLVKLDSSGEILWQRYFFGSFSWPGVEPRGIEITPAGSIYVGGSTGQAALIKLDQQGNVLWATQLLEPRGNQGPLEGGTFFVTPNENILMELSGCR